MLIAHVERYLSLRQMLGYKLRDTSANLRAFAKFATRRGDNHVRISTAMDWATEGISPYNRHIRLRATAQLARFLHAEDPAHEVPSNPFHAPKWRPLPYIYTPEEIVQLLAATSRLRQSYPLRRQVYATMFGLIAASGLRVSEALDLRLHDVLPQGVLQIRRTKFGKSRLVPLHPTAANAIERYLEKRRRLAVTDDHVFLSAASQRIASSTVEYTFRRLRRLAGIAPARTRLPRIHDLRHTFATRALEQCSTRREAVARHFVALATYLGHTDISNTYWYLEATPELMTDIAATAEALIAGEGL
jgi:integrase/recombinase XerD